jgi:hypothetical protein
MSLLRFTTCLLLLTVQSPALAITAQIDPVGYHPKAPKTIRLKDLPADTKQPLQVRVVDPKVLDPIFLKPKTVYKATLEGRTPQGDWLLPLTGLQAPGTYQLQIGKTLLPDPLTVTPGRYWLQAQSELTRLLALQALPAKMGELACETEPHYLAHSGMGWRTDAKARQKLTAENAMAMLLLMQWHQVNPRVQNTLSLGRDTKGILPALQPQLRWLMDMHTTSGLHGGMRWATEQRCYTLLPADIRTTLLGIAALGKASQVYRKTDLGFAVKCLMLAEDLWQQLPKTLPAQSAQLMGLASAELWLATQKPLYESAFWQSVQQLQPEPFSSSSPLALGVADLLKFGDGMTPDQKSWLSDWLNQPLPDLASLDGLTHRLLVSMTQDNPTALHQVASHLPADGAAKNLPAMAQWVWINALLNEQYNQLPAVPTLAHDNPTTVVEDPTKPDEANMSPQAVLSRWAARRHKKQAVQSNVPITP